MRKLATIYVDDREKERPHPTNEDRTVGTDMLKLVRSHRDSPTALPKHLIAGDFCFAGNGEKGPCLVGIERKRIRDMLSSMRLGRYTGEQVPKLIEHYDYKFLVIEGTYRTNWYSGLLEDLVGKQYAPISYGRGNYTGLELESFLISNILCTPIKIKRTRDERETVEFLIALNHRFSEPWDKNLEHVTAIHQPEQYATIGKASTVRRVAYCLQGIGWDKSGSVEQNYKSVWDVMSTDPNCTCIRPAKEYEKLPKFGKVLSKRMWDQLHGNYDPGVLE